MREVNGIGKNEGFKNYRLLRLKEVLEIIPVSESTWWEGVRTGIFPKPVKLGPRISAWKEKEIIRLAEEGTEREAV